MNPTIDSLNIVRKIAETVNTFHHHYHILYDLATQYYDNDQMLQYVEIGAYAGGSACLMLQRPNTNVISIDIGYPINRGVVLSNTSKYNVHGNSYDYVQEDSHDPLTKESLRSILSKGIDILFIDGDHSYIGVHEDFNMYESMVNTGGFIIFDDYNDRMYSPEVKKAVEDLLLQVDSRYLVIGTVPNKLNAFPVEISEGNCFIIRKTK
jgi:predicted O-methyltransferase YrrM